MTGHVPFEEFSAALTPEEIRTSRVIQAALMLGPLLFALAVAVLHTQAGRIVTNDTMELVRSLSVVLAGFALVAYGISTIAYSRVLARHSRAKTPLQCIASIRTAMIVRMALLEGVAFFGLVVCLVAEFGGVLHSHPEYWLTLLPTAVILVVGIGTFPTRERIEQTFKDYLST